MYTMHQNLKEEVFSAIMIIPIPRIHTSKKKKKERKKEKEGKKYCHLLKTAFTLISFLLLY